jgi:hypothetical protein
MEELTAKHSRYPDLEIFHHGRYGIQCKNSDERLISHIKWSAERRSKMGSTT